MKLLTKDLEKKLPPLYTTQNIPVNEKTAILKLFTPWTNWTWYAVEYDPNTQTFFGLIQKGSENEWGYFSLIEMQNVKGSFGLKIERDIYWTPRKIKEISSP